MAEEATFLSGEEPLLIDGQPFADEFGPATVLDFWRWAFSAIRNDVLRGALAEFIVARLIGEADRPRPSTTLFDICTKESVPIEVKCSAYVNEFRPTSETVPSFGGLKRRRWSYDTGPVKYDEPDYQAAIYVLALLSKRDRELVNPLDLSQWMFYVLTNAETREVAQDGMRISLRRLEQQRCVPCRARDLKDRVVDAIDRHRSTG